MDLNGKLIIKVELNDEIRKMPIHNEEITYDELIIMMERIFKLKLKPNDEIIIKYKDEDNDLISIYDDSDLAFAIKSSEVLKLVLTVENEEKSVEKSEKECPSLDMKTIIKEVQLIRDHMTKLHEKLNYATKTTEVDDYHCVEGKEFDPLSLGTKTQFQSVPRNRSTAFVVKNVCQPTSTDISMMKSDKSQVTQAHIQQSLAGTFRMSPSSVSGEHNTPHSNIHAQHIHTHNPDEHRTHRHDIVQTKLTGTMERPSLYTAGINTSSNLPPQSYDNSQSMTSGFSPITHSYTTAKRPGYSSPLTNTEYHTAVQLPDQSRSNIVNFNAQNSAKVGDGQQVRSNLPPTSASHCNVYQQPQQQERPTLNPQRQVSFGYQANK